MDHTITNRVTENFSKVTLFTLIWPCAGILFIVIFLLYNGVTNPNLYGLFQKELFLYINDYLSTYPEIQLNLTQFGDALVILPFTTIFIRYSMKFWAAILNSVILLAIISQLLKWLFAVPRPAALFDQVDFNIIGDALHGSNSLPSGHAMTTSTILTVIYFAFKPLKLIQSLVWTLLFVVTLVPMVFSRVAVGAHFPLDVVFGCLIGIVLALIGIELSKRTNWWGWFENIKLYPIFLVVLLAWISVIIYKIFESNLSIFYLSITCLVVTFYLLLDEYLKKRT